MKNTNILKKMQKFIFFFLIVNGSCLMAAASLPDLRLFTDAELTTISIRICPVGEITQIHHTSKPLEQPLWTPNFTVSDPDVNVITFDARKDANDNIVVCWIGENALLGVRCLYMRYFLKNREAWSPITMVSSTKQNLVETFSVTINTQTIEVFWTIYDEKFAVLSQAASFTL